MSPQLTVFIPVHNALAYLDESIASVLNQAGPSFELLLIDDGSTDGSYEKLQLWAQKDTRIRLLRNKVNKGVSFTSNRAIDEARGEYLVRLDADDLSLAGRHTRLHKFLQLNQVQVVGSGIRLFGSVSPQNIEPPQKDADIKARFMPCAGNIANPASSFNLAFVREHHIHFREDLAVAEDLNFWIDCMVAGAKFMNLPDVLVAYRIHDQQTGRNTERLRQAQALTRRRLFELWYPEISAQDAESVVQLAGFGTLNHTQLMAGFQVIDHMLTTNLPSRYGENQDYVKQYFATIKQRWIDAMQQAQSAAKKPS